MNESSGIFISHPERAEKEIKETRSSDRNIAWLLVQWMQMQKDNLTELKEERVCLVKNILFIFQDSVQKFTFK